MAPRGPWLQARRLAVLSTVVITAAAGEAASAAFAQVKDAAFGINADIVAWRRALHTMPELMYQEKNTSRFIQDALTKLGVPFTAGWAKNTRQDRIPGEGGTGIVATIGSGEPPFVALRSDIDALPIEEETDVPFRSRNPGRMHACGHDAHSAMLLGAAKLLRGRQAELPGTVRLIWQPAEEGGAGAKRMREEGALEGISRILGLHVFPNRPSGTYNSRPGVIMAAADLFEFNIVGRGGHGAMPHLSVDPVLASAAVVTSLQAIVARETDPLGSAVVSVTTIKAGDTPNVIPDKAFIGGTLRALDMPGLELLRARLVEVATSVAQAHRCRIEGMKFMPDPFEPTFNDPSIVNWLASSEVGLDAAGVTAKWDMPPIMGAEDFAFYSQWVPAAFVFLGTGTGTGETASASFPTNVSLHNAKFNIDEDVLHLGTALHAHFAVRSLEALSAEHRAEL